MLRTISKQLVTRNNAIFIPTKGIVQAILPKRPSGNYLLSIKVKFARLIHIKNALIPELNSVKLMGTIEHEVKRMRNGSIKLYLKTINEDTS